ncbi:hypothetical protein [Pseudoclavibacter sp. RFBA6]|uniref:hypothetical protein n=1 Tax=Pseudoclavibacter sp. RFBA6 TaxID=2080573 RepID=UPI000CE7A088|nr:hypothetical protein [Pseudoclavibacter sp. RFBA6]PPG42701.1 hypothetical protein C5C17_02515 [Pseudoclavibacter sp. RFBA6]
MTEQTPQPQSLNRRSLIKAAAWTAPAVGVAIATPLAAASINNASIDWSASQTDLLSLRVLDSQTVITAQALITVPTQVSFINGPGAISAQSAVVTITVGRPTGINLTLGRARGFGVYSYNGVVTTPAQRSAVYQTAAGIPFGFPLTTWSGTQSITVASNGTLNIPVVFGLAGVNSGVGVSALATFPVAITIVAGGRTFNDATNISVPVGAGVL